MDHFEGRTWPGWHHHVTLTFMAMWYLSRKRWMQQKEGKDEPLPTLPEVRRQAVRAFGEKLVWDAFKHGAESMPPSGKRLLAIIEAGGYPGADGPHPHDGVRGGTDERERWREDRPGCWRRPSVLKARGSKAPYRLRAQHV